MTLLRSSSEELRIRPIRAAADAPENSPALAVLGASKRYPKASADALSNLSLTVRSGEIVGLVGPNGAGKSTAIRACYGRVALDRGRVELYGRRVGTDDVDHLRQLGIVPQAASLDAALSVRANLVLRARLYGHRRKEAALRATEAIGRFDLGEFRDTPVSVLPGGIQRRAVLARALIHSPSVLLLDEPTVGLDPDSRYELWSLVRRLARDGAAVLFSTHYMEEAERLCNQVCFLHRGTIVAAGAPADLVAELPNRVTFEIEFGEDRDVAVVALDRTRGFECTASGSSGATVSSTKGSATLGAIARVLEAAGCQALRISEVPKDLNAVYFRSIGASE